MNIAIVGTDYVAFLLVHVFVNTSCQYNCLLKRKIYNDGRIWKGVHIHNVCFGAFDDIRKML